VESGQQVVAPGAGFQSHVQHLGALGRAPAARDLVELAKRTVSHRIQERGHDIGGCIGWADQVHARGLAAGVLPVPQDFVKSPVFPFNKFPGVDPALGPEMRSTGEVMGVGANFGEAFGKAQIGAGTPLPEKGTVFISVNEHHKPEAVAVARKFAALGFQLVATRGTAAVLRAAGLACKVVFKVNEGRPNAVDRLKAGAIQLAVYTTAGAPAFFDEKAIRRSAVTHRVPCISTMSGARAAAEAMAARKRDPIRVWSLQEIYAREKTMA
jgi:carbamoyl-phosphate synthase large subunit